MTRNEKFIAIVNFQFGALRIKSNYVLTTSPHSVQSRFLVPSTTMRPFKRSRNGVSIALLPGLYIAVPIYGAIGPRYSIKVQNSPIDLDSAPVSLGPIHHESQPPPYMCRNGSFEVSRKCSKSVPNEGEKREREAVVTPRDMPTSRSSLRRNSPTTVGNTSK